MFRSYNNSIFTCLNEQAKEFVKINAKCENDVLPLCTYIRQLAAAGRCSPRNWILTNKQLEKIRLCYQFTIPEPGTNFGIIMCKNFLQPRQQDNFDIKKPKSIIVKGNNLSMIFYSNSDWKRDVDNFMSTSKYEMILSVKNTSIVYISFTLETELINTKEDFRKYILEILLRYCMCIQLMEISKSAKTNVSNVYFVVYVHKKMEDYFLYVLYNLYNIPAIQLIFTSNRNFFKDRDLNIMNSTIFLYCFLTDRYKPEREDENDDICNYMVKLISTVTFEIGGKSLKRNGLSKCGTGPLAFVISEAGITETAKLNGTLEYPKTRNEKNNAQIKQYKIDSAFERMFLNLPIRNGILFSDYKFINVNLNK